jgi:hypothetical protein
VNQPLQRGLKRLAGMTLCLLGLMTILFLWNWAPPPYSYVYLAALVVAGASLLTGRPRGLVWTSIVGLCLACAVSGTFFVLLDQFNSIDWAHSSSRGTVTEVVTTFAKVFLAFALGLRLWNEPIRTRQQGPA